MKKIMSEKKVDSNFFKIKLGTLDKKTPSTMYIDAGTYITANNEKEDYKNNIVNIEKEMRNQARDIFRLLPSIKDDFLLVTDVAVDRISTKHKTHFTVQVYFKPADYQLKLKKTFKQLSKEYIEECSGCLPVFREIIESNGFSCSKTK